VTANIILPETQNARKSRVEEEKRRGKLRRKGNPHLLAPAQEIVQKSLST
jgi:hypothetical protein